MQAFPIITYPFGIIYLTQSRSNKLQKIKNTFMTRCWKYYSRSCIERVLMPNKERSRGQIDVRNLNSSQVTLLRSYFNLTAEISIDVAVMHAYLKWN